MRLIVFPGLQLLKNLIILPFIDMFSLLMRLGIMVINLLSRISAYTLGHIIYTFGTIWDPSIGFLFSASAQELTLFFNELDNVAGKMKQSILFFIEVTRSHLCQWAFVDSRIPKRCERIPHDDKGCLLKMLLDKSCVKPESNHLAVTNPVHSQLFSKSSAISTSGHSLSDKKPSSELGILSN